MASNPGVGYYKSYALNLTTLGATSRSRLTLGVSLDKLQALEFCMLGYSDQF